MCYKQKCKVVSLNLAHPVHNLRNVCIHNTQTPVCQWPHKCLLRS